MTHRTDIEAALRSLQQGEYKRAFKSAQSAARKAPADPVAPNIAGIALSATGKPNEAIAQFQKALKLQPAFTDAQRNLAQTLILIGKPESALSVLRLTVRSEPDDWKGWMLMAQAHSKAGQDGQARTCADKAIERAPRSGSALHLRSGILLRLRSTRMM